MKSIISKEEMKKRRDKDQIARDKMISEGGIIPQDYNENSIAKNKGKTNSDRSDSNKEG